MVATFGIVYAVVFFLIEFFRALTPGEGVTLAKSALYSLAVAAVSAILLTMFVYLF